jgi:hypothetical protein
MMTITSTTMIPKTIQSPADIDRFPNSCRGGVYGGAIRRANRAAAGADPEALI